MLIIWNAWKEEPNNYTAVCMLQLLVLQLILLPHILITRNAWTEEASNDSKQCANCDMFLSLLLTPNTCVEQGMLGEKSLVIILHSI